MRDVVFEWYVPYIPDRKKQLLKAVMISAVIVFFFDAVFFASGMLLPAVLLAVIGFFLFRSWKYEYEYLYVNGELSIAKVIRQAKRKDIYHVARLDIEGFVPGRISGNGRKEKNLTSNRPDAKVYTIKAKGENVYIEPSEEFIDEMSKYYHGQAV